MREFWGIPRFEEELKSVGRKGEGSHELKEGVMVAKNEGLHYLHYLKLVEDGKQVAFEAYLSDEARTLIKILGWKKIREVFKTDIDVITNDPFGERSIDPKRSDLDAQERRTVNRISSEFEEIIGHPIAVKGTGINLEPGDPDREDLLVQYLKMRELEITSRQILSPAQQEILEFLPVYGAIRYPIVSPQQSSIKKYQEWLIMKRVDNARWIRDTLYAVIGVRDRGVLGFDAKGHARLIELFKDQTGRLPVRLLSRNEIYWEDVVKELRLRGIHVGDIAGRNVLWRLNEDGKKLYTVIDQK